MGKLSSDSNGGQADLHHPSKRIETKAALTGFFREFLGLYISLFTDFTRRNTEVNILLNIIVGIF